MLVPLRLEGVHDRADFFSGEFHFKRNKHARLAEISVIFGNLVLQNQVIPECVPGRFGYESMILMRVVAVMRENQIRRELLQFTFRRKAASDGSAHMAGRLESDTKLGFIGWTGQVTGTRRT
jgi:hypothetical protein